MKNHQINLDNNIISFIEKVTKEQQKTRYTVIREALSYWIKHKTIDEFETKWICALQEEKKNYSEDTEAWMNAEQWDESLIVEMSGLSILVESRGKDLL